MRGCDITTSAYNAAASNAPYAATANARMLIRRRCSNAYNANASIRSRDFNIEVLIIKYNYII